MNQVYNQKGHMRAELTSAAATVATAGKCNPAATECLRSIGVKIDSSRSGK